MSKDEKESSNKVKGRPVKNIVEPIHDTPERVGNSIMQGPPKEAWDYLKSSS